MTKSRYKSYYCEFDEYWESSATADEVIWDDDFNNAEEEETGVLDQHGAMIFRTLDKVPFGFHNG